MCYCFWSTFQFYVGSRWVAGIVRLFWQPHLGCLPDCHLCRCNNQYKEPKMDSLWLIPEETGVGSSNGRNTERRDLVTREEESEEEKKAKIFSPRLFCFLPALCHVDPQDKWKARYTRSYTYWNVNFGSFLRYKRKVLYSLYLCLNVLACITCIASLFSKQEQKRQKYPILGCADISEVLDILKMNNNNQLLMR